MRILALFLLLFTWHNSGAKQTLSGRAVRIVDGDTFVLLAGNKNFKIRLLGIDAPERGQDFGTVSKQRLGELLQGRHLTVVFDSYDRNGRVLGTVMAGGEHINARMVSEGMAWHFTRYSRDPQLARAELEARKKGAGLWKARNPVAPWLYRKQKHTL